MVLNYTDTTKMLEKLQTGQNNEGTHGFIQPTKKIQQNLAKIFQMYYFILARAKKSGCFNCFELIIKHKVSLF